MSLLKKLRPGKNKQDSVASSNPDSGSSQLKRALSSLNSRHSSNSRAHNLNAQSASTNPFATPTYINPAPPTRRPAANSGAYDPPPAYEAAAPSRPVASTKDDQYAFLSSFDTVFLIDDSGSMAGRSWRETAAAISAIAPICTSHDADGIDIHFLNAADSSEYCNIKSVDDVSRIFRSVTPYGQTFTGKRLRDILQPYLRKLETMGPDHVKPLNIIVITDGVPSDDPESEIITAVKKLEKADAPSWQIGIQFFQVGNEYGAAEALRELDDGLKGSDCPRDIVDTVPWNGGSNGLSADGILKVVLGAVNKRLDRKRNSSEEIRGNRRR